MLSRSRGDECGRSALCAALATSQGTNACQLRYIDVARAVPRPLTEFKSPLELKLSRHPPPSDVSANHH